MKKSISLNPAAPFLLALLLALPAGAQFFPGMSQGGGRSRGGGSSSASTRTYPNNSTVGDAVITVDPDSRSLIVISDDDTSQYISNVVANLDRPKPQVLIKVVFLELLHRDGLDIGVEGGFNQPVGGGSSAGMGAFANAFGLGGLNSASNAVNSLGQPISALNPAPPGAGLYQVLGSDYQVTLRAIAQAGRAKVLSRPSVLARSSQPATILVGQSVPLITSVRYDTFGQAINGITYTDVGIILRVTPFITANHMIEMIVQPEISTVSETDRVQIQQGAFAPVIDKRSADTVVVTPDAQTVVIGGLIQDKKAKSESKIPLLGDIPWLGNLFKHTITADVKTELLIFLTPHIVESTGDLARLSEDEKGRANVKRAFTEDELHRYLDALPNAEIPSRTSDAMTPPDGSGQSQNR
jgi:general secretion pathway protein D